MSAIAVGIGMAVVGLGSAIFGASSANKEKRRARAEKKKLMGELKNLEANRQAIINPYEGITDLSSMVTDLSAMASNPFANLAVATGAAEMQIEEADIALANTLDTLRATGASAGGATALARMALESKKGVSASIQQQEAQNNQMRASGEERLQSVQMQEAKRVQSTKMAGAERLQDKKVSGEIYEFETRESRDEQQMARKQAQITGQAQAQAQASSAYSQSIQQGVSALGNAASAFAPTKPST